MPTLSDFQANPRFALAQKLLEMAKAIEQSPGVPYVQDGRPAEGGPIPVTPYVEISQGRGLIEQTAQHTTDTHRPRFYVIFYVNYDGARPEDRVEVVNKLVWEMYEAVMANRTLSGFVDFARALGDDYNLIVRESKRYWFGALELECSFMYPLEV